MYTIPLFIIYITVKVGILYHRVKVYCISTHLVVHKVFIARLRI